MLCLGRRIGEKVVITIPPSSVAQTVEVMVLRISPESVRLGFATLNRDIIFSRVELIERQEKKK